MAVGGDLFTDQSGFSGVTTYPEKPLMEYMKRDGFLPGDVLGAKASTLPRSVPNYSNSRLGQWAKQQAAQTEQASKAALAATSGRPVLGAAATAATRVGGPVLDALIGTLNPQFFAGFTTTFGFKKIKDDLERKGVTLIGEDELYLRKYLAQGDWDAVRKLISEAYARGQRQ